MKKQNKTHTHKDTGIKAQQTSLCCPENSDYTCHFPQISWRAVDLRQSPPLRRHKAFRLVSGNVAALDKDVCACLKVASSPISAWMCCCFGISIPSQTASPCRCFLLKRGVNNMFSVHVEASSCARTSLDEGTSIEAISSAHG